MSEDNHALPIDFTKIRFPSDSWTIADLRKRWPEAFDIYVQKGDPKYYPPKRATTLEFDIAGILETEREYAYAEFLKALGLKTPGGGSPSPADEAEALINTYVEKELVRGPHEARELLRDVKEQVLAQVEKLRGQSPA